MAKKQHITPLYSMAKKLFADSDTQAGRFEWYLILGAGLYVLLR